ncbi:MAG TPA: 2Fe-2S iron-sulfur cluster-binding protein, partial [Acidimicrobiales bacterium]|nr:2Fe-2S iron-sulfur cluster-binding protein [Acidimicrobiales bacterium]
MRETVVEMVVNGELVRALVDVRKTLADFLREDCRLTGTHLGCEHGVCGACTVLLDGSAVRSCLLFAAQAQGSEVVTVEGLTPPDGLSPVQAALR